MEPETTHQIRIDNRLASYTTFFDHEWARKLGDLVAKTKIDDASFALCMAWKSAANTHALPWMMMHCMEGFANGLLKGYEPFGLKVVSALAQRIPSEMGDSLSNMRRKQLASIIQDIGNDVYTASRNNNEEFDVEQAWTSFLDPEMVELHLSIWGSQRICYGALLTITTTRPRRGVRSSSRDRGSIGKSSGVSIEPDRTG